jgi:hypothetical protein
LDVFSAGGLRRFGIWQATFLMAKVQEDAKPSPLTGILSLKRKTLRTIPAPSNTDRFKLTGFARTTETTMFF